MNAVKTTLIGFFLAILCFACIPSKKQFVQTGNDEIDNTRKELLHIPTYSDNYLHRMNVLEMYSRLIMYLGGDLSSLTSLEHQLKAKGNEYNTDIYSGSSNQFQLIDSSFSLLEKVFIDLFNTPIEDFQGKSTTATIKENDWPLMRQSIKNSASIKNQGPAKGNTEWKFPIGRAWYAKPAVENGKVYVVSPGMTSYLYCLDEETGQINWKTYQRGNGHQYGTPRMNSSVEILQDKLIVREVGSGGNMGLARHLVYVDKTSGKEMKQVHAGHIDYRVGYAPFTANEDYVVYPHGMQEIGHNWEGEPVVVTFDSIICRDNHTSEIKWKFYIGNFYSEPILHQKQVIAGNSKGELFCLNLEGNTRIKWKYKAKGAINVPVSVLNGKIVVSSEDGKLHCLNAENGDVIWVTETLCEENRSFQKFSKAELSEDRVIIGTSDKRLLYLDILSGTVLWEYQVSDWIRSKPLLYQDKLFAATLDGKLYEFSIKKEQPILKHEINITSHSIMADLVAGKNKIFINSTDLYLNCFSIENNSVIWKQSLMECVKVDGQRVFADFIGGGGDFQSSPIVVGKMLFIGGPERFVYGIDKISGKEIWKFETRGTISCAPIYSAGKLYFGQQGGTSDYYCINAKTGEVIWKQTLGWVWASTNLVGEKLIVSAVNGFAYCLDKNSGEIIWKFNTGSGAYPSPAIEDNIVVIGTWDKYFIGLDLTSGKELWRFNIEGFPDSGASIIKDGKAYLNGLASDYLYCVDLYKGVEIWRYKLPENPSEEANVSISISDDKLVFSTFVEGSVCRIPVPTKTICLNKDTGEKVWSIKGGGGLTGSSIAARSIYFAGTNDPFFWNINLNTGKVNWKIKTGGRAEESCPAISGGKAYILLTDGYLYSFR